MYERCYCLFFLYVLWKSVLDLYLKSVNANKIFLILTYYTASLCTLSSSSQVPSGAVNFPLPCFLLPLKKPS